VSTPVHVNSATCIVGPTGSGKSSLIATLAEYVYETYQSRLYLATLDGGGFPALVQAYVRQGVIRVWRCRTRGEPFETCMRAAAGWWPAEINPETGETVPNVKLVPPITQEFTARCPDGHVLKVTRVQSALPIQMVCPTCKKNVNRETMLVSKATRVTKGFEERGAMAIDGITSALGWMMIDMAHKRGAGQLKGEEGALGGTISSGEMVLGSNNRAHYGFAQTRGEEMVLNSLSVPNLKVPPIFTALLLETVDEGGLPVKGPKLAGKAKTDEAPAWFGNCLEAMVVKDDHGNDCFRLNLREYVDDAGVRHLCKNRGAPGTMPAYLQDPPDPAQAFSQFNLGVFFRLLDEGVQKTEEAIAQKFSGGAVLPERMTFGEEEPAASTSVAAPVGAPASPRPAAPAPVESAVAGAPAPPPGKAPQRPVAAPVAAGGPRPPSGAPPAPRAPARAPVASPAGAAPELETTKA
jgi:energy-coupling factor transporter ATP-binding protein EcfA2